MRVIHLRPFEPAERSHFSQNGAGFGGIQLSEGLYSKLPEPPLAFNRTLPEALSSHLNLLEQQARQFLGNLGAGFTMQGLAIRTFKPNGHGDVFTAYLVQKALNSASFFL